MVSEIQAHAFIHCKRKMEMGDKTMKKLFIAVCDESTL